MIDGLKAARRWVMGIEFDLLALDDVRQICKTRPADASFAYIATPSAAFHVRVFRGDSAMMRGLDQAGLIINDSRVAQRLDRLLFGEFLPLATGSDLTRLLLEQVIAPADPIVIIGGNAEMADSLRARFGLQHLMQFVPGFGFIHDPAEIARCVDFVAQHPARFVFIACGAPQSECLAAAICEQGSATGLGLCIGASLEFVTGQKRRAPQIWQLLGLEWLYRVMQEPRRLGNRLWSGQLPFLLVALQYRVQRGPVPPVDGRRTVAWHSADRAA